MSKIPLQIFSIMRVGSTYLIRVLNKNFNVSIKETIDRHLFNFNKTKTDVLVMTREVYSWLPSFHKMRLKRGDKISKDFATFVTSPWEWTELTKHKLQIQKYKNPVDYYVQNNIKYFNAIGNFQKKLMKIKYIDLLADFNGVMEKINKFYNFNRPKKFVNINEEVRPNTRKKSKTGKFDNNRRSYYINKEYMKYYDKKLLDFVNSQISDDVLNKSDYKRITELI